MDTRRYDRNADQLTQILTHLRTVRGGIYISTGKRAQKYYDEISDAIDMILELIKINDELGFATAKGWI
jgi:hypothetical protein